MPKLWENKTASEFLGSSWASSSTRGGEHQDEAGGGGLGTTTTTTSVPPPSSSRTSNLTTVRSVTNESSARSSKNSSHLPPSLPGLNVMKSIQKHNHFGRQIAKELQSSMSPSNSPRPPRKLSKSPSAKKNSTSASPGGSRQTSRSPYKNSSNSTIKESSSSATTSPEKMSKISKMATLKDSKKSSVSSLESIVRSPLKKSSSSATTTPPPNQEKSPERKNHEVDFTEKTSPAKKKLLKTKTIRKDFSVDEYPDDFDEDDDDHEPRPVPQPRPRVTIKKASNVSEKGPILEKTKKQKQSKSRPKSAPAVKKSDQATPPTVDLRSYSKSLKLLGE